MLKKIIEATIEKALEKRILQFEKSLETEFQKAIDKFNVQFEKLLETEVQKAIDRRTIRPDNNLTVEGYHPLPVIMGRLYSWVFVPFGGVEILVEVKYLSAAELPEVDKLSLLINKEKNKIILSRQQMIDLMNTQEECCRAILSQPTFEELEHAIYSKDKVLENRRKELEELRKKINTLNGQEKQEQQMRFDKLEILTGYILPKDTMLALTNIALGMDISDIKKVTKEKLIAAYSKARLYNGRPSDYISGIFTDGDRTNIDDYATMLGLEEEEKNTKEQRK